MWDIYLATIKATTHRIELKEDTKPLFQPRYGAGQTKHDQEKKEIKKMLKSRSYWTVDFQMDCISRLHDKKMWNITNMYRLPPP